MMENKTINNIEYDKKSITIEQDEKKTTMEEGMLDTIVLQLKYINNQLQNMNSEIITIKQEIITIKDELNDMKNALADVKDDTIKMNYHVDFVNEVYDRIKSPFHYLCDKVEKFKSHKLIKN